MEGGGWGTRWRRETRELPLGITYKKSLCSVSTRVTRASHDHGKVSSPPIAPNPHQKLKEP